MCQLKPFKNIILLGVNHQVIGNGISLFSSDGKWVLPNGDVKINGVISQFINDTSNGDIAFDNSAHNYEHSLEVQLPLLIEIFGDDFQIIPLSIWDYSQSSLEHLGSILIQTLEKFPQTAILSSSDFSHYETADFAQKQDNLAIDKILKNDNLGFYETVKKNNISLCGLGPIYALLKVSNYFQWEPSIVEYTNSGETTGDLQEVVAYCGIEFI